MDSLQLLQSVELLAGLDRDRAHRAATATLATLAERLGRPAARQLAGSLPGDLGSHWPPPRGVRGGGGQGHRQPDPGADRRAVPRRRLASRGRGGRVHGPVQSAGPPPWHLYFFTLRTAFGVATAEPHGATRWRFG